MFSFVCNATTPSELRQVFVDELKHRADRLAKDADHEPMKARKSALLLAKSELLEAARFWTEVEIIPDGDQ